jgi:hypothetical protein
MFFIISAALLASVHATSYTSTSVEGQGSTTSFVQTTVNGNTTTIESDKPGEIKVEKSDTGETITSDNPVTVTHTTETDKPPTPTIKVDTETQNSIDTTLEINNHPNWLAQIRSLWDRVKNIKIFDILTRK